MQKAPNDSYEFAESLLANQHCYLVRNCLDRSEQTQVFQEILERSKNTDNSANRACMNPTPKTIIFDGNQSTIKFSGSNLFGDLIVSKANAIILQNKQGWIRDNHNVADIQMSVGVIRYPVPDGHFPLHVDHCNDHSWVYLLSLGCTANFVVQEGQSEKRTLSLKSGDVLVFDPSTKAAITHGVQSIVAEYPAGCPEDFQQYRFGVQCRVKLNNS